MPFEDGSATPVSAGSEEISSAYPFKTKNIDILDSSMSYIDEGQGDPIVFLHGNPTWSYLWRNVIPHLTPLGRCIAPDLIGMGRSGKPAIQYGFFEHFKYLDEFLQKLALDRITLVIHDWGSGLGFHYANLNRNKIRGIVFMEALIKPYPTWDEFPARSAPAQLRDAFRAYRSDKGRDLIMKQNLFMEQTKALAGRPLTPEEVAFYEEPFPTEESRGVILNWARNIPIAGDPSDVARAVADYANYLKQTMIPKLLFYTLPGAILLKEDVDWCTQNLPQLSSVNLDPSNGPVPIHLLQEKFPHQLGQAIAEWYRDTGLSGS